MDILTFASLDVLFLILALLIIPGARYLPVVHHPPPTPTPIPGETPTSPRPTQVPPSPFLAIPTPSGRSIPCLSPLSSPRYLDVPTITLTPDYHNHSTHHVNDNINGENQERPSYRPGHKRKSVSFSLSSIDDFHPQEPGHTKRPPTPYVSGPISPSGSSRVTSPLPVPSLSGSPMGSAGPMEISHSLKVIDPMGVQKSWLMA